MRLVDTGYGDNGNLFLANFLFINKSRVRLLPLRRVDINLGWHERYHLPVSPSTRRIGQVDQTRWNARSITENLLLKNQQNRCSRFHVSVLILVMSVCAYAEEPDIVSEHPNVDVSTASMMHAKSITRDGGAADHNEDCRCWCTPQGILLRECGGETENLGNYGNIANCNKHLEAHPQCS